MAIIIRPHEIWSCGATPSNAKLCVIINVLLKIKTFDEHTELVDIIREVPEKHIEVAKVRVKAMVDMIKNYA